MNKKIVMCIIFFIVIILCAIGLIYKPKNNKTVGNSPINKIEDIQESLAEENIIEPEVTEEKEEIIVEKQDEEIESKITIVSNKNIPNTKQENSTQKDDGKTKDIKDSNTNDNKEVEINTKDENIKDNTEEIKQNNENDNTPQQIEQEEPKQEVIQQPTQETQKVHTYKQNVTECNRMVTDFYKLINNDSNFSVEINEKAKNGELFFPYRESEISKHVINLTFGDFYVYAEDVYGNGVYQRTVYYIDFK